MKRLSMLVVVVVVGAAAAVLNPPDVLDPVISDVSPTSETVEELDPRFFFCPWAFADGVSDSMITMASRSATRYLVSVSLNGEISTPGGLPIAPDGAVGVEISSLQPVGESSVIVEFGQGPAGVGVLATGDEMVAGDACQTDLPRIWHVGGGSTADGDQLTLRLFNPFLDVARVNLTVVSELGAEAATGLQGVSIPARSTKAVDLSAALPGRQSLSVFVERVDGTVIPALIRSAADAADLAMWPGVADSETWELPLTVDAGLSGSIVLTNSSLLPVAYSVDVFGLAAEVTGPINGEIPGPGQVTLLLDDLSTEVFGARITGDGPFGVFVVGQGDGSLAAMPAARTTSTGWLLPGINQVSGADYRMWVLNTGINSIVVSYTSMDIGGAGATATLEVAAGSVAFVDVGSAGGSGLIAEATGPFSVAWSVVAPAAVAYVAGIPVTGGPVDG